MTDDTTPLERRILDAVLPLVAENDHEYGDARFAEGWELGYEAGRRAAQTTAEVTLSPYLDAMLVREELRSWKPKPDATPGPPHQPLLKPEDTCWCPAHGSHPHQGMTCSDCPQCHSPTPAPHAHTYGVTCPARGCRWLASGWSEHVADPRPTDDTAGT